MCLSTLLIYFITLICLCQGSEAFLSKAGQQRKNTSQISYRAAVYEHAVYTPDKKADNHKDALMQMMANLNEYGRQARIASAQNVDIMVFPEYGIYGLITERSDMANYIEDIPDVTTSAPWIPCDEPTRYPQQLEVIIYLSCLAKSNKMYIVANYGDAKPCSKLDPVCPSDGQYQFNTNIVFDRKGSLVAKYHKQNLFYETQFNEPIYPEHVYFDTEFGRFGTFTCFDILFHEPMIPLITKYNITDVVFPTAWMDVLPFYSAIGYHSSVAVAYNVNLLAANIHHPTQRFQGSGIYTPNGANEFYYSRTSSGGKLLISDVNVMDKRGLNESIALPSSSRLQTTQSNMSDQMSFKSTIFNDWYDTVLLDSSLTKVHVCQRGLCCFLEYQVEEPMTDYYALSVFNGKHVIEGKYYLQVCLLFKCPSSNKSSCGQTVYTANTTFSFIKLSGSFETQNVTPQIVLTNNGTLRLPAKNTMHFSDGHLTGTDSSYPLLQATMFGRYYVRD